MFRSVVTYHPVCPERESTEVWAWRKIQWKSDTNRLSLLLKNPRGLEATGTDRTTIEKLFSTRGKKLSQLG